jgi:hypothetical protein
MSLKQKQDDFKESLYVLLKVKCCYTCRYYYEKRNVCNKGHIHLTKLNCKVHKFSNN